MIEVDISQGRAIRTGRFRKRKPLVTYNRRHHVAWIAARRLLAKIRRQRRARK